MLLGREQLIRYEEKGNENLKAGVSDDGIFSSKNSRLSPRKYTLSKVTPTQSLRGFVAGLVSWGIRC